MYYEKKKEGIPNPIWEKSRSQCFGGWWGFLGNRSFLPQVEVTSEIEKKNNSQVKKVRRKPVIRDDGSKA